MFIAWGILFVLGVVLLILILKIKTEGLLRKFLILAGASLVGFPVFVVLHNLVYALFIYFLGQDFWERIGLGDEPFFFMMAVIVCPLAFLVGAIGSIVLLIKRRKA
jgi:hypothetical protein